eukprot:gene9984-13434_t
MISPNLMRALGYELPNDTQTVSDWKPPTHSGLSNSKAILKQSDKKVQFDDDSKKNDSTSESDDDDSYYNNDSVISDDNVRSELSNNLLRIVGKEPKVLKLDSDWKAPSKSGMDNSEPIIKTKFNSIPMKDYKDYKSRRGAMSASLMKALGMDTIGKEVETDWKPPSNTGVTNSKPIFTKNTLDGKLKLDEERVQQVSHSYKSSVADQSRTSESSKSGHLEEKLDRAMSASLRKALGLDTSSVEEIVTDWRPPEVTGIKNSEAIVLKTNEGFKINEVRAKQVAHSYQPSKQSSSR